MADETTSPARRRKRTACPACDLLLDAPRLEEGQDSHCPRCHHRSEGRARGGWQKRAALALASLAFLVGALSQPFLILRGQGGDLAMNLFGAAGELFRQGRPFLAAIVAAIFFVLPGLYLLGIGAVSWGLARPGEKRVGARFARIVFHLGDWSMPDVFLVGVLVSLTKIATMARIEYGASFWAFALFSIAFVTTVGTIDERRIVNKLSRRG